MSAPPLEGGQDDDDILGFPGDGFVDKTDVNPGVLVEQDEEGEDTRSNEGSDKKRKKSAVVAPDGHVTDRIKELRPKITGSNREDNEWTKVLRAKLDQKTVEGAREAQAARARGRGSSSSRKICPTRVMLPAPRPASAERRQRRCSKICAQRKTSVFCLPGKHTAAATTGHRRGARGSRTSLSLLRLMLRTRLVAEASVTVVDGICLMLADRRVEYSHSSSVSEYSRHFCVCNTNCSSFFLFFGKTGNAHTHGVTRRRTNTLPVEIRRRIDARSCVPSGCSLPVSFKTFRCAGSTDSSPLVPVFITPGELKP
jgi:hypothetical protein